MPANPRDNVHLDATVLRGLASASDDAQREIAAAARTLDGILSATPRGRWDSAAVDDARRQIGVEVARLQEDATSLRKRAMDVQVATTGALPSTPTVMRFLLAAGGLVGGVVGAFRQFSSRGRSIDTSSSAETQTRRTAPIITRIYALASPDYLSRVDPLYQRVQMEPYPLIEGARPSPVDCVTFAGGALIILGLGSGQIPGRVSVGQQSSLRVNDNPDDWGGGWKAVSSPTPGSYIRAAKRHSALYMGAIGNQFVVAESNWPPGSPPRFRVIDQQGVAAAQDWNESMGTPTAEHSDQAAIAIRLRYQKYFGLDSGVTFATNDHIKE